MNYTFAPKENHAKAYGRNLNISYKKAGQLCRVIRKKQLKRVKRLFNDLLEQKRSLRGKYFSKTAKEMLALIESAEKNAESKGLNTDAMVVYASAHFGTQMRRRRRKSAFGSKMKTCNLEVILIEKQPAAAEKKEEKAKKKIPEKTEKKKVSEEKTEKDKKGESD